MSDITIKQFEEYGLHRKSEKSYINEFINILIIKNIAAREVNSLQELLELPDNHSISAYRNAVKAAHSIFMRLSKSGTINALTNGQIHNLKEAVQLKGIFKHTPPIIAKSFDRLIDSIPEKLLFFLRTGKEKKNSN